MTEVYNYLFIEKQEELNKIINQTLAYYDIFEEDQYYEDFKQEIYYNLCEFVNFLSIALDNKEIINSYCNNEVLTECVKEIVFSEYMKYKKNDDILHHHIEELTDEIADSYEEDLTDLENILYNEDQIKRVFANEQLKKHHVIYLYIKYLFNDIPDYNPNNEPFSQSTKSLAKKLDMSRLSLYLKYRDALKNAQKVFL